MDRWAQTATQLLVLVGLSCSPADHELDPPTEEELGASARQRCERDLQCLSPDSVDDPEAMQGCMQAVRRDGPQDINECDRLWLDVNACTVTLTCEDFASFDRQMTVGCGEEYDAWKDCRRER